MLHHLLPEAEPGPPGAVHLAVSLAPDDLVVTALLAELGEALALHGWRTRIRIPYRSAPLPRGWRSSPDVRLETALRGPAAARIPAGRLGSPERAAGPVAPPRPRSAEAGELVLEARRPGSGDPGGAGGGLLLVRPSPSSPDGHDPAPLASFELRLRPTGPGTRGAGGIPLGSLPEDPALWQALAAGRPAVVVRPGSPLVRGMRAIAATLLRALRERDPSKEPLPGPVVGAPVTCDPPAGTP